MRCYFLGILIDLKYFSSDKAASIFSPWYCISQKCSQPLEALESPSCFKADSWKVRTPICWRDILITSFFLAQKSVWRSVFSKVKSIFEDRSKRVGQQLLSQLLSLEDDANLSHRLGLLDGRVLAGHLLVGRLLVWYLLASRFLAHWFQAHVS